MDKDAKATIVDFILQRTISEIDTTSDDVSEKLIALECGHIFTVETLDGHCEMSQYYDTDPLTGRYLGMRPPPIKYQTPPACPTCRSPVTSPRYGRVTKRANLDILEQNVARNMSRRLERHGPALDAITAGLEASETAAKAIVGGADLVSEEDFAQICEKRKHSFGQPEQPLPVNVLRELSQRHGFSKKEADAWKKIAEDINRVYGAIADVASSRSAHVKAYEAAMTTLFKLEMEVVALDPSKITGRTQHEAAFAAVNAKIGQPPHKADRKYHIEAFLLTIELRLMLAQIASSRISELPLTHNEPDRHRHRNIWTTFVKFLHDSCSKDCEKAISLARSCSSLRQEARINMVDLRCTFEKDRFDALEERRRIEVSDGDPEYQSRMRADLGTVVAEQRSGARGRLFGLEARYFQHRPINSLDEMGEERLWFEENCITRAEKVFAAYVNLRKAVTKPEVLYQSVSLQEKQDVVKAFGFGTGHSYILRLFSSLTKCCAGHTGHFYNCENGHTFVITEVCESYPSTRTPINISAVWWCHAGFSVSRVSSTDRRWRSPSCCVKHSCR